MGSWDGKGTEDEESLYGWESPILRTTEGATRGVEETNYVLDQISMSIEELQGPSGR